MLKHLMDPGPSLPLASLSLCVPPGPSLPLASLSLFVPPLRLVSAALWQVVQRKVIKEYGLLEEFVTTVLEIVPDLMSHRDRVQLIMGLNARLVLELCRSDHPVDTQTIQLHLNRMITSHWGEKGMCDAEVEASVLNFCTLIPTLLEDPVEKEHFFQKVSLEEFGLKDDSALQSLVWEFLSRVETLLPTPTVEQVASWLIQFPPVLEDYVKSVYQPEPLKTLLQHHNNAYGGLDINASSSVDECILRSLSLSPIETVENSPDPQIQTEPTQGFMDVLSPAESSENESEMPSVLESNHVGNKLWMNLDKSVEDQLVFEEGACVDEETTQRNVQMKNEPLDNPTDKPADNGLEIRTKPDSSQQDVQDISTLSTYCLLHQPTVLLHRIAITQNGGAPCARHVCSHCPFSHMEELKLHHHIQKFHRVEHSGPANGQNRGELPDSVPQYSLLSDQSHSREQSPKRSKRAKICSLCGKSFMEAKDLTIHMRSHIEQDSYQCTQCGEGFYHTEDLHKHQQNECEEAVHHQMAETEEDNMSTTSVEDWTESSNDSFPTERRSYKGKEQSKCYVCSKTFCTPGYMRRHLISQHGELPYHCLDCGESFESKPVFTKHEAVCLQAKRFLSRDDCSETFLPEPNDNEEVNQQQLPRNPHPEASSLLVSVENGTETLHSSSTAPQNPTILNTSLPKVDHYLTLLCLEKNIPDSMQNQNNTCKEAVFEEGACVDEETTQRNVQMKNEPLDNPTDKPADNGLEIRTEPDSSQQDVQDISTLSTYCLLHQPTVLLHRIAITDMQLPVQEASPKLNLRRKMLQAKKVGRRKRLRAKKVRCQKQVTSQNGGAPSARHVCSHCPFSHMEELKLHHHIQKFHRVEHSGPANGQNRGELPDSVPQYSLLSDQSHSREQSPKRSKRAKICSLCGKSFMEAKDLTIHMRSHIEQDSYQCTQCGEGFYHTEDLQKHQQNECEEAVHHQMAQTEEDNMSTTSVEDWTESSNDSFPTERRSYKGKEQSKCYVCSKTFCTPGYMRRHLISQHGELPYHCLDCGESFESKPVFTKHEAVCLQAKRFLSRDDCSETFLPEPNDNEEVNQQQLPRNPHPEASSLLVSVENGTETLHSSSTAPQNPTILNTSLPKVDHYLTLLCLEKNIPDSMQNQNNTCKEADSESQPDFSLAAGENEMEILQSCDTDTKFSDDLQQHQPNECGEIDFQRQHYDLSEGVSPNLHREDHPDDGRTSLASRETDIPQPHSTSPQIPTTSNSPGTQSTLADVVLPTWTGKCPFCHKTFRRNKYLKVHLRRHGQQGAFRCTQCSRYFARSNELRNHQASKRGCGPMRRNYLTNYTRDESQEDTPLFSCPHCNNRYKSDGRLKTHMACHNTKGIPCKYCGKMFAEKRQLTKHIFVNHRRKRYLCDTCGKDYKSLAYLEIHLRVHTGERPYPCAQCGKCFSSKNGLKEHQYSHGGERPYACTLCQARCVSNTRLKLHMEVHTREKAFKCHCGKAFRAKSSFKTHQKNNGCSSLI